MADAAALAPGQKAALGLAVGELLMSRRQDRYSVADLMAQLAARGLDYAEPAVVQARRAARGARAVCSGCCLVICADPLLLPYGPTLHGNELDIHFFCASLCSKGCAACAQAAPAGGNRLSAFTCAGAGTGGDGGRGRDRHGAHHVRRRRAHDLRGRIGPGTTCSARPRRGAARRGPRGRGGTHAGQRRRLRRIRRGGAARPRRGALMGTVLRLRHMYMRCQPVSYKR